MKQSGNVLFLILIAVALFAALSYAVTKSTSGSGTNVSKEKASLSAGVNDNCTASVEMAIMRVKQINGCDTAQISYELPGGGNANPSAPSSKKCHLFHPSGGGTVPCGAHATVSSVPTGTITLGDGATVARLPSGWYFKCGAWSSRSCWPWLSEDGVTFKSPSQVACLQYASGTDRTTTQAQQMTRDFAATICMAACGGTRQSSNVSLNTSFTTSHYVNNDSTLTPAAEPCQRALTVAECSCW